MFMTENFRMDIGMELGQWTTKMAINMKDHGKMAFGMGKEYILGLLKKTRNKIIMMDNGPEVVLKEKGHQ